jgi:hypothetical protein
MPTRIGAGEGIGKGEVWFWQKEWMGLIGTGRPVVEIQETRHDKDGVIYCWSAIEPSAQSNVEPPILDDEHIHSCQGPWFHIVPSRLIGRAEPDSASNRQPPTVAAGGKPSAPARASS